MDKNKIGTIAVVAVAVLACLLYSWQTYDDQSDDGFAGEWILVYTYSQGGVVTGAAASISIADADGVLVASYDGGQEEFGKISGSEAVSVTQGAAMRLYLEDDTLYLVLYGPGAIVSYVAYSKDAAITFPSDSSLAGTSYDVMFGDDEAVIAVSSHSFLIASGTLAVGGSEYVFRGFVKTVGGSVTVTAVAVIGEVATMFDLVIADGTAVVENVSSTA